VGGAVGVSVGISDVADGVALGSVVTMGVVSDSAVAAGEAGGSVAVLGAVGGSIVAVAEAAGSAVVVGDADASVAVGGADVHVAVAEGVTMDVAGDRLSRTVGVGVDVEEAHPPIPTSKPNTKSECNHL